MKMDASSQLEEKNYDLKEFNYFDLCSKCPMFQDNVKDWMKHLVDRHPLPNQWMSEIANYLTGELSLKPYTTVTESRKKRKKNITPRPLNSFMIFSRHLRRNALIFFNDASNSEISKLLGKLWNNISAPIKSMYDNEAKNLALLHSKEFPEYKYQPKKKKKPSYLTKHNLDNRTPLSTNSYENVIDNLTFSISDVIRQSNSFQPEVNSPSVSSFGSCSEPKLPSCNNRNSKYIIRPKPETRKSTKKVNKNASKVVNNHQMMDDSEGAESSPSSFKNTIKTENVFNNSPFINDSQRSLSDLHFSTYIDNLIKQNPENSFKYFPIISDGQIFHNVNDNSQINVAKYTHVSHRINNPVISIMRPLTIVTDRIDEPDHCQQLRSNVRFVKLISKPQLLKYGDIQITNNETIAPQRNIFFRTVDMPIINVNQSANNIETLLPDHVIDIEPTNDIEPIKDPLLFDDIFDAEEESPPSPDRVSINNNNNNDNNSTNNNNNDSPWQFKSPNFRIFNNSSNISDHQPFGSSSPFHLSEPDNDNSTQIHRLPAIGSWLRSNLSEFMI